ncbi:MAG: signal peptidase II [Bdellovibrionales bacterium]|nr:signal peptidase II [Bdellovibrionales bacterium]
MVNRKYLILIAIAGLIIALDQLTKLYIHTNFSLSQSLTVIENYFNITYVRNRGAAFGFLSGSDPAFRKIFFLSMPPIALIVILYFLHGVKQNDTLQIFALSSVFGGAIGNYIDRIRYGYVIDFLDFHYHGHAWPAFNVADCAIVCGVTVLFLILAKEAKEEKQRKLLAAASKES